MIRIVSAIFLYGLMCLLVQCEAGAIGFEWEHCDNCSSNSICMARRNQSMKYFECVCTEFFDGDGLSCHDIDECVRNTHDCVNAECINMQPKWDCNCNPGFIKNDSKCIDVNECVTSLHSCDGKRSFCVNTFGSYRCECKPGYQRAAGDTDGRSCEDIDECQSEKTICPRNSYCANEDGSYQCSCISGYEMVNGLCEDIDECSKSSKFCNTTNSECKNKIGSYECVCHEGYRHKGENKTVCHNIDECKEKTHTCPVDSSCEDTDGDYDCDCIDGHEWSNTTGNLSCADIDECSQANVCDKTVSVCNNTKGSYECDCMPGYTRKNDKYACHDIDECTSGSHTCDTHAFCTNVIGSFSCECAYGFTGDGFNCTELGGGVSVLKENITKKQEMHVQSEMKAAEAENAKLQFEFEYYKRLCGIKTASESKKNQVIGRRKRSVLSSAEQTLELLRIRHKNSALALEIQEYKIKCGLNMDVATRKN